MTNLIHHALTLKNGYESFLKNIDNTLVKERFYEFTPYFLKNKIPKKNFLKRYIDQGFQIRYREEFPMNISIVNPFFQPVFSYKIHQIPQKDLSLCDLENLQSDDTIVNNKVFKEINDERKNNYIYSNEIPSLYGLKNESILKENILNDDFFQEINDKNPGNLEAKQIYEKIISNEKENISILLDEELNRIQQYIQDGTFFLNYFGFNKPIFCVKFQNKFLDKKTLEILDEYKKFGYTIDLIKPQNKNDYSFFSINTQCK